MLCNFLQLFLFYFHVWTAYHGSALLLMTDLLDEIFITNLKSFGGPLNLGEWAAPSILPPMYDQHYLSNIHLATLGSMEGY